MFRPWPPGPACGWRPPPCGLGRSRCRGSRSACCAPLAAALRPLGTRCWTCKRMRGERPGGGYVGGYMWGGVVGGVWVARVAAAAAVWPEVRSRWVQCAGPRFRGRVSAQQRMPSWRSPYTPHPNPHAAGMALQRSKKASSSAAGPLRTCLRCCSRTPWSGAPPPIAGCGCGSRSRRQIR